MPEATECFVDLLYMFLNTSLEENIVNYLAIKSNEVLYMPLHLKKILSLLIEETKTKVPEFTKNV